MDGMPQAMPGPTPTGGPAAMSPQPEGQTFGADQATDPMVQMENMIDYALMSANLAKEMRNKKQELLDTIGVEIVTAYEEDEASRSDWLRRNEEWMKLSMLIRDNKTWPWPKASNVKYPLLATAAMQFSARAYPALVPADGNIVRTKVVPQDPTDQVWQAAERVSKHMSWQILQQIPNWEEDMDKLLMTMAISGICFKKTYYDEAIEKHCSHIVYPENLCINYWAKNLEDAYRKTEILYYTDNDIKEKVNNDELFLDLDFPPPTIGVSDQKKKPDVARVAPPPPGKSTPHVFLACHTFYDLDEDGYEEPYIITVHKASKQVVRIVARWTKKGVIKDSEGKIKQIIPLEYFTDFPFIPNPDGSIYALGFGLLLGPLNESTNTIINQLVDAGTLANMPSGFIGKGLRLRIGQTSLSPGEFKVVNATGEDLQKSVWTLPIREPSQVLFNLLNMLITSGNQLASIAEIFVGKMPGQNTPATTTQETVRQGMAVFTAIYKRVYRSLGKEFRKIYFLNKVCPDIVQEESKISGIQLQASDYDLPEWTIIPAADPTGDSRTEKQAKLQQVGQFLQMGTVDPMIYTRMTLDALEIQNAQQLIKQPVQPPPPPPDPRLETEKLKQQTLQQKAQLDSKAAQQEMSLKEREAALKERESEQKLQYEQMMQAIKMQGQKMDQHSKMVEDHMNAMMTHAMNQQKLRHTEVEGRQKLHLNQKAFEQKQAQNPAKKE